MTVTPLGAELVLQADPQHGEGPVWDARRSELIWLDILGGDLHRYHPGSGEADVTHVGDVVAAALPRGLGGVVLAVDQGLAFLDQELTPILQVLDDPAVRFNEGKCDPAGRLWVGTMAYDAAPGRGALYRLDTDLSLHLVLEGVTIANGMAWSADARSMFFIDSDTGGVDAFEYDIETGGVSARRRLLDVDPAQGVPDGMAIDAEGGLWVALFGGGAVHRYTPSGRLDRVVELPVSNVTSCAFGGEELRQLYITTSRVGLTASELADQPLAGGVFVCDPGVTGAPVPQFAG